MRTINVPMNTSSYDVHIQKGLLLHVDHFINPNLEAVIITDKNIPQKYLHILQQKLNIKATFILTPGESLKQMTEVDFIIESMIKKGITRSITLIALGGGVIGDLTGFIASIYMRGVDFIQIPTSLLAQVDSSVGGKVGINTTTMKNSIGSFYQPKIVLIDPETLDTLEERHFNNGMAELIKHAVISGKGLFNSLLNESGKDNIEEYIYQSVKIKRDIVIQDEKDQGIRQILNFGHTIGHAIEQYSNYGLLHGEAISIGMAKMAKGTPYEKHLLQIFHKYNLPITYDYDIEKIYNYIKTDKKIMNKKLNLVFVNNVGNPTLKPISLPEIKEYL